jgi:hypothetical protein
MTTPPRELHYQKHRYVLVAKSDLLPAIRKDTGKKVMVAPEILKEQPQEYEPRKLFLDAQHGDVVTERNQRHRYPPRHRHAAARHGEELHECTKVHGRNHDLTPADTR